MWVRFGRWLEVGVHFGRQQACLDALDRYLVHASLRFGTSEWNYGPDRVRGPLNPAVSSLPSPRIDLHPDPEPLRWGVRKFPSASNHPEIDHTPIF